MRNDGDSLMQMIGAEHKKTPPVVAERALDAPHHTQVPDPFKGEQIRFYRIELDPGETTGPVRYDFSGLMVSLGDANLVIDAGEEATQVVSFAPGAHLWHDGPLTRSLTNIGETRFIAMLGEWR